MKTFFVLVAYFIVVSTLIINSDLNTFSKDTYIDQKVLDLSMPLSVKIDTELLNSLKPANEQ
jgi:hypothetical protein